MDATEALAELRTIVRDTQGIMVQRYQRALPEILDTIEGALKPMVGVVDEDRTQELEKQVERLNSELTQKAAQLQSVTAQLKKAERAAEDQGGARRLSETKKTASKRKKTATRSTSRR